ncbi:MAG: glycosyltransferase family 39 protein [Chloroflexi bacterium]|nr:glycosyltransferase family 39 protein [Chloroflexota bacterium]
MNLRRPDRLPPVPTTRLAHPEPVEGPLFILSRTKHPPEPAKGSRLATRHWPLLALVLAAALAVRLGVILSPLGWLEADEAVVGLMARHILEGDRPVFYWGQSYMGALEAYSVALAFALLGANTFTLKLVPALYSVGFVLLSYLLALRLFGRGPALLSALYLALPPTMLAVWSVKPRGGYAELLCLGQAALLLALALPAQRRQGWWSAGLGLVAGLAFWTNQLAVLYLVPIAAYLGLQVRQRLVLLLLPALLGFCLGAAPLIADNLSNDLASADALKGSAVTLAEVPGNVRGLWRLGLPVLVGLGQPTSDVDLWRADWPTRPAGNLLVALAADALLVAGLFPYRRTLWALVRGKGVEATGPALLVGLFGAAVVLLPFTRFAELVTEPRYALPLYTLVPLYAALAWRLRARRPLFLAALLVPLALNLSNLATADPWLGLPTTAGRSTPENRTELIAFLASQDLTRVYADYWLTYPLAFESQEQIVASVLSNGFNRFTPYAHLVHVAPRPAFVLVHGSREAEAFYARVQSVGARATIAQVSIYDVVHDLDPLDPLRP